MASAEELWLPVADYEGLYEVSDAGRVRSLTRFVDHGTYQYERPGRVLTQVRTDDGYWCVRLFRDRTRRRHKVHRLVALAFLGLPPNSSDVLVLHANDDRGDNSASNLRYGTAHENWIDGFHNGRHHCVLAAEDIAAIRASELPVRELARRYEVGERHIRRVRNYQRFKFLS